MAQRDNKDKLRFDLIPARAMAEVAAVFTFGAKKYSDHNWRRGMKWSAATASLERHLNAFKAGQDRDEESGLLHLSHLVCNALFLLEYYEIYPEGDDRPRARQWRVVASDCVDALPPGPTHLYELLVPLNYGGSAVWDAVFTNNLETWREWREHGVPCFFVTLNGEPAPSIIPPHMRILFN